MMPKIYLPNFNLKNNYIKVFLIAIATATIIFLPFVIADKGLFLFYGDYNVQQIPFYKLAHEAVRSGNIWWSFNTDLGANFVGSYSFYLLGSPFFWLTIPFPTSFIPYLMAPLFILKFGVASVTAFGFISRFTKSDKFALIGALMYAFSGFAVYNIFFNHFNDVIALFPLLLIALEEFIVNRRHCVFILTVALMACVNYFFFAGQVIFIIIYFIFRSKSQGFKYNIKQFLLLAFESILGVLLASILLLPSLLAIIENPRITEIPLGWDFLTYGNVQRYLLIFQSFFFPPDIPARPNFFPDSNAKWSSVAGFLPLFGMTGVIAFLKDKKKHFVKYIIITCIVLAFIPGFNSIFYMMNSAYYARWFYMPILLMSLATVISLENKSSSMMYGLKWSAIIVGAFTVIGIIPSKKDDIISWFSLPPFISRFWLCVVISVLCLLAVFVIIKFFRTHKYLSRICIAGVCVISVIFSMAFIATGKMHSFTHKQVVDMGLNAKFNLPESQTGMYRVDVYNGMDNYPMFWNMPTIQTFHSIVPASVITFYNSIGIERGVASRPDVSYYGLRGLTSVKYLFYDKNSDETPTIPGFQYYDTQNGFDILENTAYVPMAYTYNNYITNTQFEDHDQSTRDVLLTGGMLLSNEQINKYGQYMSPTDDSSIEYVDETNYLSNCSTNARNAATHFNKTNNGFTCDITTYKDNLVYFSVPYDKGFTAYVNGTKTKVENVNNGFCAVFAPSGVNTIDFVYHTPGIDTGAMISLAALILFLLYAGLCYFLYRRNPEKYHPLHKQQYLFETRLDTLAARDAYINTICNRVRTDVTAVTSEDFEDDSPGDDSDFGSTEDIYSSEEITEADNDSSKNPLDDSADNSANISTLSRINKLISKLRKNEIDENEK